MRTNRKLSGYPSIDRPWMAYYHTAIGDIDNGSAIGCLRRCCERRGSLQDSALAYFTTAYTYAQLFEQVEAYARAFYALGIRKGDIVALALPNTPENVFAVYGLNRLGAVANLVDLRSCGSILHGYLRETDSRIVLACDLFAEEFIRAADVLSLERVIVLSAVESLPLPVQWLKRRKYRRTERTMGYREFISLGSGISLPPDEGISEDPAVVLHTSGTTDFPKSVVMSNRSMNAMAENFRFIGDNALPNQVFLNQVPPFLAYNIIMATHLPLMNHVTVRLLPDYRPDLFARNVSRIKPNYVIAGPADWGNFLEDPPRCKDYSFLCFAGSGSDSLSEKNLLAVNSFLSDRGCRAGVMEGYGMTEIGAAACCNLPWSAVVGSVGVPLPQNNFCLWDNDADRELPYGEVGEICMTGPTLMSGYYRQPEITTQTLRPHEDGQLWLHSGDLGYMDERGFLYLVGRLKRVIVRHDGIKISPHNIEQVLLRMDTVTGCCVVAMPDRAHGFGSVAIAFVTLSTSDSDAALEQATALCEKELSEKYRPSAFRVLTEIPLTPNGKVDYRHLESLAAQM